MKSSSFIRTVRLAGSPCEEVRYPPSKVSFDIQKYMLTGTWTAQKSVLPVSEGFRRQAIVSESSADMGAATISGAVADTVQLWESRSKGQETSTADEHRATGHKPNLSTGSESSRRDSSSPPQWMSQHADGLLLDAQELRAVEHIAGGTSHWRLKSSLQSCRLSHPPGCCRGPSGESREAGAQAVRGSALENGLAQRGSEAFELQPACRGGCCIRIACQRDPIEALHSLLRNAALQMWARPCAVQVCCFASI